MRSNKHQPTKRPCTKRSANLYYSPVITVETNGNKSGMTVLYDARGSWYRNNICSYESQYQKKCRSLRSSPLTPSCERSVRQQWSSLTDLSQGLLTAHPSPSDPFSTPATSQPPPFDVMTTRVESFFTAEFSAPARLRPPCCFWCSTSPQGDIGGLLRLLCGSIS